MKVTLDLTRLLAEGRITRAEYEKLSGFAHAETGSLAFNILIGFGVVAVAAGAIALVPNAVTGIVIGGLLMALGLSILVRLPLWLVLANICIAVAALMFGGGVLVLAGPSAVAFLAIAVLFLVSAALAGSGLLVVFGVLMVGGAIGAGSGYEHATYELSVEQPLLTIVVFAAVALGAYRLSRAVGPTFERLSLTAARTAVFLVNLGFWIGSLWGDRPTWSALGSTSHAPFLRPDAFAVAWALALAAAGIWAVRANRRWVVNLVAVFGAIHFYTQWFERLDATPATVFVAGVVTLAVALGLWKWNQRRRSPA